jgi:hypothetical protein
VTDLDVPALAARVLAAPRSPRLVGVDGPGGAGKSTIARALVDALGPGTATLVEIDDFISWTDITGWWPRLESEVLVPLLAGRDARYQARDWSDEFGSSLGPWKTAPAAPVVVLEGISCTRRAIADRLDLAVWVEADRDLRLARGLRRDGADHRQLWLDWMTVEDEFFTADGARGRADVRVDTTHAGPGRPPRVVA